MSAVLKAACAPRLNVPPRTAAGVGWTGVLARLNVPFDDAAAMPVMLRGAAGETIRASAGRWPVPLVYPYPGDDSDPSTASAMIPRAGGAHQVWTAPTAGGVLVLYGTGTATGELGSKLRNGQSVTVHADVSGVVSLTEHRGVTVIALDAWRLCKIVAHGTPHTAGMCRIWAVKPQGVTQ